MAAEAKEPVIVYLPEQYAQKLKRLAEDEYISVSAAGRKYLVGALDQIEEKRGRR